MKEINLRKWKIVILSVVPFLAIGIIVLFISLKRSEVDYFLLHPVDVNYTILASCSVGYPKPLDMTFQHEGIVKNVLVREGDRVFKGQKLIELDNFKQRQQLAIDQASLKSIELKLKNARETILPNLRENLREAEFNLQMAKINLERYRKIESAGGIPKSELQRIENDYERALSRYNQAKTELENFEKSGQLAIFEKELEIARLRTEMSQRELEETVIKAPFDGEILKIHIQAGERTRPGSKALTLVENKRWNFILNVDQRELPFLRPGLKAYVILDAFPDRKIESEIVYICTEVRPETNTCELRIEVKEDLSFIKYGMAGKAEILAERFQQVLAFPARLIRQGMEGEFVWIWENNVAKKEKIKYERVGERLAIAKNLEPGTILLDAQSNANPRKIKPGKKAISL